MFHELWLTVADYNISTHTSPRWRQPGNGSNTWVTPESGFNVSGTPSLQERTRFKTGFRSRCNGKTNPLLPGLRVVCVLIGARAVFKSTEALSGMNGSKVRRLAELMGAFRLSKTNSQRSEGFSESWRANATSGWERENMCECQSQAEHNSLKYRPACLYICQLIAAETKSPLFKEKGIWRGSEAASSLHRWSRRGMWAGSWKFHIYGGDGSDERRRTKTESVDGDDDDGLQTVNRRLVVTVYCTKNTKHHGYTLMSVNAFKHLWIWDHLSQIFRFNPEFLRLNLKTFSGLIPNFSVMNMEFSGFTKFLTFHNLV